MSLDRWGLTRTQATAGTRVEVIRQQNKGRVGTITGKGWVAAGGAGTRGIVRVTLDATDRAAERVIFCYPSSLSRANDGS